MSIALAGPPVASTQEIIGDLWVTMKLALPSLVVFGPNDDAAQARAPAIAWRPTVGRFAPGQRLGAPGFPATPPTGYAYDSKTHGASSLWTRELEFAFECFGGSSGPADCGMSPTEGLVELLVNCLHQRFTMHGYKAISEKWINGGRTGVGLACELTCAVRIPLLRLDNPTVTITQITPVVQFEET
jgi:hypothetical protein